MNNEKYSRRRSALAAELMQIGLSAVMISDFEQDATRRCAICVDSLRMPCW